MANVTGLKYDRVEAKFVTYNVRSNRSEAEVRLAAFRHSYSAGTKECVSATNTVRLIGNQANTVSVCKWRWMHGIQFGWDYTESDSAVYTIELQHRNPNDCPQEPDDYRQVYGFSKLSKTNTPDGGALAMPNNDQFSTAVLSNTRPGTAIGWYRIGDNIWEGKYEVSQMHYCVGLDQERLAEASPEGWFFIVGGDARTVRAPNVNEPYFSV
ncbi:hypothetical protein [Streptomyces spectabilis]|uniref:Uncharacterized protein n=1 Tax=Streptomyces spectabilis TaxID=68270 RepID=A0A516RF93_STRST|nr:hypothetical protein [Streptomyces spectabilis]QDQ14318.1 hypothetical protein FH965_30205 [Streptomyces spectabilis]